MFRVMKVALLALMLFVLPALSLADAPVLLVDLPEGAQMVENVEFEGGDFIQSYQLEDGVTVQLLRYTGFAMEMHELIASDWPLNCGVEMQDMTEISGCPAKHAKILQAYDGQGYEIREENGAGGVKTIELVVVSADNATLILQIIPNVAGAPGDAEKIAQIISTLQVQGAGSAEVG